MPELQAITYEQVINVLTVQMQPMTPEQVLRILRANPMSPRAREESLNTVLHHLQAGAAAGEIEVVDNLFYFVIGPMEDFLEHDDVEVNLSDYSDSSELSDGEDYETNEEEEEDDDEVEDNDNDEEEEEEEEEEQENNNPQ